MTYRMNHNVYNVRILDGENIKMLNNLIHVDRFWTFDTIKKMIKTFVTYYALEKV